MKISKAKRIAFALFTAVFLLAAAILPSGTVISQIDYEAPIPLGVDIELGAGLTDEQIKLATENYYKSRVSDNHAILENIEYNFRTSIDEEKYYGGAYWEGDPRVYDEDGNMLLQENGKPVLNRDLMEMHILVTDMRIVPKIDNPKLFFHEVKYSWSELEKFVDAVVEKFPSGSGLAMIGPEIKKNQILISFVEGTDISPLFGLLPEDAYYYEFVEEDYAELF